VLRLLCAALLALGLLATPVGVGFDAVASTGSEASSPSHLSGLEARAILAPASTSAPVIRQAYDLVLDRFVYPLNSADLLRAATEGAFARVAQVKAVEWPAAGLSLSGEREADWVQFVPWFEALGVAASPEVDRPTLEQAAVAAMAVAAQEAHTRYLSPAAFQEYRAWTRGDVRYAGIGARLRGAPPTVVEVFEGSPAERAGLRAGDAIVAIDDASTDGGALDSVIGRLRGSPGTQVRLLVARSGLGEPFALTLTRDEIKITFVRARLIDPDLGYVKLRGFPEPSTVDAVTGALADLHASGARALVLDLRGNSGGRIDVGVQLASRMVKEGPLLQQIDRNGQRRIISRVGAYWEHSLPVAVLIDRDTASMGEIFAIALREAGVARLIGTKTSGSVAAAQVFPLPDGSALQVTVLEIVSGQGTRMNGIGVEPDDPVEASDEDLRLGRDPQLEAAIGYLRARATGPLSSPAPTQAGVGARELVAA
jgi:carboxyl-terminal processing protease